MTNNIDFAHFLFQFTHIEIHTYGKHEQNKSNLT